MKRTPIVIILVLGLHFISYAQAQTKLDHSPTDYFTNTIGMVFKQISNTQSWMVCVHEVRQCDWVSIMETNPSYNINTNCPVEMISYVEAEIFCKKLGEREGKVYRLPTIKEWVEFIDLGRFTLDQDSTVPVYSMPVNRHGLYGIEGNVSEWCSDAEESEVRRVDGKATKLVTRAIMGNSYFDLLGGEPTPSKPRARYAEKDFSGGEIGFRVILEGAVSRSPKANQIQKGQKGVSPDN